MPRAKLQDRRTRDLEHDERVPDASQRVRPGQADERREDDPGDRVRRADELQIGRRQAHALAVRDGAVQEHARRTVKDSPTQPFTGFPGTMPFAFTRRHLSRCLKRSAKTSCVAVLSHDGASDLFHVAMRVADVVMERESMAAPA